MKILISSHCFSPSIGGIESVSALLGTEFVRQGHEVTMVTQTPGPDVRDWPFEIVRQQAAGELWRRTAWCDVFWHNNISLQTAWPLLARRCPWVVTHQTWIAPPERAPHWRERLKYRLLRRAKNIAISQPIAAALPVASTVVPNPYQAEVFRLLPEVPRDRELVFLGRLVPDKGVDLLLQALARVRERGLTPRTSIIGGGPELEALTSLAAQLGLDGQVEFSGPASGLDLAKALNRHRIMVVPSRWAEPFGIVALEGIACGCVVLGSSGGGLPEAIGPSGLIFESGNVPALDDALQRLLTESELCASLVRRGAEHLRSFTPEAIAAKYAGIFSEMLQPT